VPAEVDLRLSAVAHARDELVHQAHPFVEI